MDVTRFDDILLGILQNCEQMEPFLETVFYFLARRTDFFRLMHSKEQKYGFPPGVAEAMVMKIFKKYQKLVLGNKFEEIENTNKKRKEKGHHSKDTEKGSGTMAEMKIIESMEADASRECEKSKNKPIPSPATPSEDEKNTAMQSANVPVVESTVEVATSGDADVGNQTPQDPGTASKMDTSEAQVVKEQSPVPQPVASTSQSSKQQEPEKELKGLMPGTTPESYNGAILDHYTWSQSVRDIDMRVPVPTSIIKARDVGVEIKSDHLKVFVKKNVPIEELKTGSNILVNGKLQRKIRCEESMWSLEPGKCIVINLEKHEERFWTTVIEGDPEIDKTKVDSTRSITDFDEQTQCDYERVMFDHHQKLQGKPTSQETNAHEMLKKAWDAKGSPFAGTPFDPSKVNISPGSGF